MAKKKMTPAQAASARRPDDWEPPAQPKPAKKKASELPSAKSIVKDSSKKENRGTMVGFLVLFVAAAIAAPFIVIYASRLFGFQ